MIDEVYDVVASIDALGEQVSEIAPEAAFRYERISDYPLAREIAAHIARLVSEQNPDVVFLGSDNVGRIVTSLMRVATPITSAQRYDVYVVRYPLPP